MVGAPVGRVELLVVLLVAAKVLNHPMPIKASHAHAAALAALVNDVVSPPLYCAKKMDTD